MAAKQYSSASSGPFVMQCPFGGCDFEHAEVDIIMEHTQRHLDAGQPLAPTSLQPPNASFQAGQALPHGPLNPAPFTSSVGGGQHQHQQQQHTFQPLNASFQPGQALPPQSSNPAPFASVALGGQQAQQQHEHHQHHHQQHHTSFQPFNASFQVERALAPRSSNPAAFTSTSFGGQQLQEPQQQAHSSALSPPTATTSALDFHAMLGSTMDTGAGQGAINNSFSSDDDVTMEPSPATNDSNHNKAIPQTTQPPALEQIGKAVNGAAAQIDKRGDGVKDSLFADMARKLKREKKKDYWELGMLMGTDEDYVVDLFEGRRAPTEKDIDVLEKELGLPREVIQYVYYSTF